MTAFVVGFGQSSTGLSISTGDSLVVAAGGSVSDDLILQGGSATISGTAALAIGDVLSDAGVTTGQYASRSTETVISGGQVTATEVQYGGLLYVSSGGTATSPNVASGGSVLPFGGTLLGGTVYSGGVVEALGGSALGVTVEAGGSFSDAFGYVSGTVLSGGTADFGGVSPSETLIVTRGTLILSGGVLTVDQQGDAVGTTISFGGTLSVMSGAEAAGTVIAGGTLDIAPYGPPATRFGPTTYPAYVPSVIFSGGHGTLLDENAGLATAVSGFDATDRLVLAGAPADGNTTYSVSGDYLTLSFGQLGSETLNIIGASSIPFTLGVGPGATGDIVLACYCAGTAVLTPAGEVPVETIAAGDLVITADGRAEPVTWVGLRSYTGRVLASRPHLQPVRFKAGALGNGLPRRDLLVSPCHAMLLDGVLVQAGSLTNGCTIVQDRSVERVDYFHIELARHDVILAEGAASETYLDDGNRMMFANADSYRGSGNGGDYCAPRAVDGYKVEAIRRHLAALAGPLSQAA